MEIKYIFIQIKDVSIQTKYIFIQSKGISIQSKKYLYAN